MPPEKSGGILPFVITFVASLGKYIAAVAPFVGNQSSGFSGAAAHADEYVRPLSAAGTFYLGKLRGMLSFVTTIQQHGDPSFVFSIIPQRQAG